jgi:hypothetical protein
VATSRKEPRFIILLLEAGYAAAGDSEDVEEIVPEGFGFCILRFFVLPLAGESERPVLDLVPAQRH